MRKVVVYAFLTAIAIRLNAQNNPVAAPKAVLRCGSARFTVLAPGVIRLEYDSTQQFNSASSFIVINRRLQVPSFTRNDSAGWLVIKTAAIQLHYRRNSGPFNAANLFISGKINWHPGLQQKGNLGGTYRTLDRMDGDSDLYFKMRLQLENGLLARDGWTLLDDSQDLRFDDSGWVAKPKMTKAIDWYFFAYGHDYKTALLDFTKIAGKVPLPPRYAFGYWWSRYWSYSDNELRDLVGHFHQYHIPLDVLVIDMDWHKELSPDQWTGWSFNDAYFPDSKNFLNWAHTQNLKVTLNLHPAFGIAPGENTYRAAARALGIDTAKQQSIPYKGSDKKFMATLFNQVLHPLQQQGVDFWWLDWQQEAYDKAIPQLDNVWWLNYTFFKDAEKSSDKRPIIYHRWGGLGNHRYQTGFSGDTYISWKSLAYQPYFTNTASNVLYGYWSHDIGGHMSLPGQDSLDPELYTRWIQYGALSPIFRTHSSKNANLNKEVWNYKGDYFVAITNAIRLRYQLAPYIYTMARKCYDTGISLCRPLYYDYPENDEAYSNETEYFFGDDILVAPIGAAMQNGRSEVKVWLPPGNDWYEWHTGTLLKGDQTITRRFTLNEYPIYIKAGSIIPMYADTITNLQKEPNQLVISVFPGATAAFASLYQDNGDNQRYTHEYARSDIRVSAIGDRTTLTILPRDGQYAGMHRTENMTLKFYGILPPKLVTHNDKQIAYHYSGNDLCVVVEAGKIDPTKVTTVSLQKATGDQQINDGLIEKMKRLRKAIVALKYRNADLVVTPAIGHMEELNRELEYHPQDEQKLINIFNQSYARLPELVKDLKLNPQDEQWFLQQLN